MKDNFSSRFNNEKGVTLVMVMMVMIVLSVLGMGILGMAVNNTYLTSAERDYQSAYYIAEAGVAKEFSSIENAVTKYYTSSSAPVFFAKLEAEISGTPTVYNDFENSFGETPSAVVTVTKGEKLSETSQKYTISSQGTIGQRKRTVERDLTINWQASNTGGGNLKLPADMAVFTETFVDVSSGARISGNTGTNSSAANTIILNNGGGIDNGVVFVPAGAEHHAIDPPNNENKVPEIKTHKPVKMELPEFPEFPNYPYLPDLIVGNGKSENLKLTESVSYKEIKVSSNQTLSIDTGNSDKAIVVDHLNISSGHITLTGNGTLTFYVKEKITLGSSTINAGKEVSNLNIYLKSSSQPSDSKILSINNSSEISGTLYAEDARIDVNSNFRGYIITGGDRVTIGNGANYRTLLFAPEAAVDIQGGSRFQGAIYSHSFVGGNGSRITYEEVDFSKILSGSGSGEEIDPVEMISTEPITEVSKQ